MKTKAYHNIDKSDWPRGPWDDEPDKMQWPDAETGLPCIIVRNGLGGLCGYVGIASGRLFGVEYEECDVDVHGGLTFSEFCDEEADECRAICHVPERGEPDRVWWLGFDCVHVWDSWPTQKYSPHGEYRDLAYVQAECAKVAKQLHEMGCR